MPSTIKKPTPVIPPLNGQEMECNKYDGSHGFKSFCEPEESSHVGVSKCHACRTPLIQFNDGGWYKLNQIELKDNQTPEYE